MQEEIRKSGITAVGDIPWGTHFCQFYQTKKDLIESLVPYFQAGLENNEFCMWVTADNLSVKEAQKAMTKAIKGFSAYSKKGQIEILSYTEWYLTNNLFDKQQVLERWVKKLNHALEKGYDGLRLTGNTFWLEKKDWRSFTEYEEAVNDVIGRYKMIALCTYCLDKCSAGEIIDVVRNHEFALIKQKDKWEIFENSHYKAIKADLVESEKRFRLAFKNAPITVAAQDSDLHFLWAYNQRTRRPEEVLGKTDFDIFPLEDAEKLTSLKRQVLQTGKPLHENIWVTSNGKKLYLELFLEPVFNEKGLVTGVEIATVDLTGKKIAEEALYESEERYRRLFENNSEGVALCEIIFDKNGKAVDYRFVKINLLFEKIIGLTNNQISGKSASKVLPNVQRKAIRIFAKVVSKGEPVHFENYSRDLSKWFDVYAYRTGPGQFAYMVIDITARKTTETALKESEEKFRALTEASPVIVSVTRVSDSIVLYINKSYSESLGYKQEELIGKPALNVYYDLAERKALIDKLNEQGYLQNYKVRVKKSNGTPFWASSSVRFIEYGGERAIMAASIDITEFKQAEEQKIKLNASIQQEKERLTALVNSIPDEVWFADTNKNFTLANPSALREFNYNNNYAINVEALARSLEVLRPDGNPRPVDEAPPLRALKGESVKNQVEMVRTPATRELRYRQVSAAPVKDAEGNIIGSVSIVRDITQQKKAEELLRATQRTLEEAQKIAILGSWEWNTQTGELRWSKELYDIYGVDPDSFVPTMELFGEFIHPDDRELLGQVMNQLIAGGKAVDVDFRIILRDKSVRYLHATSAAKTLDNMGKGIVYIGTTQDITTRKKAEDDISRLNRELQAIRECDQAIVHDVDEKSLLTDICSILCLTAGYRLAWIGEVIHDEAKSVRPLIWKGDEEYISNMKITWADTERGRGPTGSAVRTGKTHFFQDFATAPKAAPWREAALSRGYLSSIALPLKHEDGSVFAVLSLYGSESGIFTREEIKLLEELASDLSFGIDVLRERARRRQAEIQIAHLATFPELNPDPVIELDTNGKITYLNPAVKAQIPDLEQMETKHPFLVDVQNVTQQLRNNPTLVINRQIAVGESWWEQTLMFLASTNTYRIYARNITKRKKIEDDLKASEERFSKAFHSSPVALSISDSIDGTFIDVNESFQHLFGYKKEELVGQRSTELNIYNNPHDRDEIVTKLQHEGRVINYEVTAKTKTGSEIRVLTSAEKIEIKSHEHIIWTTIDITEREQAEDLLRETSNYLSNLLDYANAPIIVWDPHFRISRFNPAFERLTGYKSQDVLGLGLDILFPKNKKNDSMQQIRRTLSGERWEVVEIPILRVDGELRTVLWNSANVYDNDGKTIIATIAQGQDVTERKHIEDKVNKLNEILKHRANELEVSNKELEAFAYSVSHDLRAPLRSMEGFAQALLEDCYDTLNNECKDYLKRIQASAELMSQLIDDMLRLSRITRADMNLSDVDLSKMAQKLAARLNTDEPVRKVKFVITSGITAHGDERLLAILLDNLFENAWKFSSKTPETIIEFGTIQRDGQQTYFVRDNGVGFDMTYVDKLFKPFQRLHSTGEFPGTGIGLASAQRIVQRHGGQVWAEGKTGEGATFYFTLG
jgi:PAS domain S-box-containing protein